MWSAVKRPPVWVVVRRKSSMKATTPLAAVSLTVNGSST
jgi:hypothetical protein